MYIMEFMERIYETMVIGVEEGYGVPSVIGCTVTAKDSPAGVKLCKLQHKKGALQHFATHPYFYQVTYSVFSLSHASKPVIIRKMLHNIFHGALQNVAQFVDGIDLNIFIFTQAIQLRAIHIVLGIQRILGNTTLFHGFP